MAAAALLAATLKLEGALIMQIQGGGPLRLAVVECTSDFTMRAMAQWEGEVPEGSLEGKVGEGRFAITLDPRDGSQSYQGVVSLEGDTLAEALMNYMSRSEQLETHLWLDATESQASGMLLQQLPSRKDEDPDAWNRILHLGSTLSMPELHNLPVQTLIHRLFNEDDVRLFESQPVSFRCSCSRDKVAGMLRMLGHEEVHSILEEEGKVDVICEFCNRNYSFDPVDAEQLFAADTVVSADKTRH